MIQELVTSFLLGLGTPLTAVCVLPLFPGFLAFLSKRSDESESHLRYGMLVITGVIFFMAATGAIFTFVLQESLTGVVSAVSPVAFALLGLYSLLMIAGKTPSFSFDAPRLQNPSAEAFGFGFFFGAIVLPCNPALISVFFARSLLISEPFTQMSSFLAFGLGIGAPLLLMSAVSKSRSGRAVSVLQENSELIEKGSGVFMLAVSIYYLFFVF